MKYLLILLSFSYLTFTGCSLKHKPLVDAVFIDSLMNNYKPSKQQIVLLGDADFWKKQIDTTANNTTALLQYASDLSQFFKINGEISFLDKADSILEKISLDEKENDAGVLRSLAAINITRHQFKKAETQLIKALKIGSQKYTSTLLYFDAELELGNYSSAIHALNECKATNQYGYFFRMSKWKHYTGEIDSAIYYMQKAADWSGNNTMLKQGALSNEADLLLHDGLVSKAYSMYKSCLLENAADFHSLQSIGKIALMYDDNTALAEKIFQFVAKKYQLPDVDYNLIWVAEQREDSALQYQYANTFSQKASYPKYGNMYNKYLIDVFSYSLQMPVEALKIAENELQNRATSQTYAWYVWALHMNNQNEKAKEIYDKYVSGKPLETLELFYMGKFMKDLGKNYNAIQFFKAAEKNKYDLSPKKQKELVQLLK